MRHSVQGDRLTQSRGRPLEHTQELEVNSNNVYLYLLAEHYGIDYEKKGISVRGHIYWAEYEENVEDDYALLSFDTESALVFMRLVLLRR